MKFFKRLILSFAILLILFFIGATLYVRVYGKNLIEETLTSALKRSVALENVSYQFPLSLRARNIRIARSPGGGKFFEARDVLTRLSIDTIYQRRLVFDSVVFVKPLVVIEGIKKLEEHSDEKARRHGAVIPPERLNSSITNGIPGDAKNQNKNRQRGVILKQLVLEQGRFQYTNKSIQKDFSFSMEDVSLKAVHLAFPLKAGRTDFSISGRLIKRGNPLSGSSVEGSGWADIVQRNMDVKIEVIEADGSVGMTAEAVSRDNDMDVKGEVKFQNIFMKNREQDTPDSSAVNKLIFNALSSAGVKVGAKFSFKTKMDDFRPEHVSFSGNVVTK